jgi:hypothetical protein
MAGVHSLRRRLFTGFPVLHELSKRQLDQEGSSHCECLVFSRRFGWGLCGCLRGELFVPSFRSILNFVSVANGHLLGSLKPFPPANYSN